MRIIDADALFKAFEKVAWYNNADRDEIAEEILLQMPTIEQPKWIPVTERLPQEDEPLGKLCEIVQVLLKDGTVTVGFCNRSLQAWVHLPIADIYFVGQSYTTTPVIAWMPLAQPPKGDE